MGRQIVDNNDYPNQVRSYLADGEFEDLEEWRKEQGMSRSSAIRLMIKTAIAEFERREKAAEEQRRREELYRPRPIQDVPQA